MRTFILSLALSLALQQPAQSQRSTLEGAVYAAGSTDPIANVQVSVVRVAGPTGAQIQTDPLLPVALTDRSGKFSLKDLPAGTYRAYASRNGYSRAEYGEKSIGGLGTVVTAAGQPITNMVFRLTPAGTVTGRLTDGDGEPLINVSVELLRVAYDSTGLKTLRPAFAAMTNDRGEYRIYWVNPGRYYVDVNAGRTAIDEGLTSAAQEAFRLANQPGPSQQGTRDTFAVAALLNNNVVVSRTGYVTTYYPGTTVITQASIIEVKPGAETGGIDFRAMRQPVARIRGRVMDARGQPAMNGNVALLSRSRDGDTVGSAAFRNSRDGSFEIRDVPPGIYLLRATLLPPAAPGARGAAADVGVAQALAAVGSGTPNAEARLPINIGGIDLDNVLLNAKQGVSIQGRAWLEGAAAVTELMGYERLTVVIAPANDGTPGPPRMARLAADGSFTAEGVFPGQYRVRVDGRPMNVFMKDVRMGSTDLMRDVLEVSDTSPGATELLLNRNAGQVAGSLVDSTNKPVAGGAIVLIPTDYRPRRELYRTATTDSAGQFSITAVTPGNYKVFSWEELEAFSYYDPEVIARYEARGAVVRVAESEKSNVAATIIGK